MPSSDRQSVVEAAAAQADGASPAAVRAYFRAVPTEELQHRGVAELAELFRGHVELAARRSVGEPLVRLVTRGGQPGPVPHPAMLKIVTDDMPFLVDSVTNALAGRGVTVRSVIHPQLTVRRDDDGRLVEIVGAVAGATPHLRPPVPAEGACDESWMHIELAAVADEEEADLVAAIEAVLADVRTAVRDWPRMVARCTEIAEDLAAGVGIATGTPYAQTAAAVEFLRWLVDDHFAFLGSTGIEYGTPGDPTSAREVDGAALGLTVDPVLPTTAPAAPDAARVVLVTSGRRRSTVHRAAWLDEVRIRRFDEAGSITAETVVTGLFTASAYTEPVESIPIIREKVAEIIRSSGFTPRSHGGKDILGTLATYPRSELFQADVAHLQHVVSTVVRMPARHGVHTFLRRGGEGTFISCLVYVPRDRYTTRVRERIQTILTDSLDTDVLDFTAQVSESAVARLHFAARRSDGGVVPQIEPELLERVETAVVAATLTWSERVAADARELLGVERSQELLGTFADGFPVAYRERFGSQQTIADLKHLTRLGPDRPTSHALYRPVGAEPGVRRYKLFRTQPLSLTAVLPIFTDMGVEVVDEQPYEIERTDGARVHVYDFGLRADEELWDALPHEEMRDLFESAVGAVWSGQVESDRLGSLVLLARLTWRQVAILRMLAGYVRQASPSDDQVAITGALVGSPDIAALLVKLFETRFDPDRFDGEPNDERAAAEEEVAQRILAALEEVESLDADRILRMCLAVVRAALRTTYYRAVGAVEPASDGGLHIGLKLEPGKVPGLPAPLPAYEMWVHGPQVEGVHLRFGAVARGGLRWSDRRTDFRTEVLGLVKAQMVKNAVIVPTGSKGGFYATRLPDPATDRDAWFEAGRAAYTRFIGTMLDLTDNRVEDEVVPPERTVRHDGDDPYLVVAADKGTATFSDTANAVAAEHGFWLDDAFASGGSAGYDHKAMGITARGAWESVKRHFRERGIDTQTQDFTVVGIGDMSGDVFGNGMLLSEHIRLVAAFDHRHVFIDPAPDAAASHAERRRLFETPRSSWDDYDRSLISAGGGVWPRTAKSIPLSPEAIAALGLPEGTGALSPNEVLRAVLLAPVDLLWNGGIGTYVKSSRETDASVGDRANDAIRVDGADLRVRVVGEGGNLGLTQLGRIEAARAGVAVNTDAIDNSAGVDTSDHEVNIKILLGPAVASGELSTDERNELLASMTDEVAQRVLRHNHAQNVVLGNARAREGSMLGAHQRFMRWLEERGILDRSLEFLPSDSALERLRAAGEGLASPELSVLVAYAKLALKEDVLASDVPDDPWCDEILAGYFPERLRERFADGLAAHPLRREIVTTRIANDVVDRGGITFVHRAVEETGASVDQVVRAFLVAREVFDLPGFSAQVDELDSVVPTAVQAALLLEIRRLLDRAVRWLVTSRRGSIDVGAEIERFRDVVAAWAPRMAEVLTGGERERLLADADAYAEDGVPQELALRTAGLLELYSLLDVVDIAHDTQEVVEDVVPLYFGLSEEFGIDVNLIKVSRLPREELWDAMARAALRDDLYAVLAGLTRGVIAATPAGGDPHARIAAWLEANERTVLRARTSLRGIEEQTSPSIAALSVALRTLRSLVQATG